MRFYCMESKQGFCCMNLPPCHPIPFNKIPAWIKHVLGKIAQSWYQGQGFGPLFRAKWLCDELMQARCHAINFARDMVWCCFWGNWPQSLLCAILVLFFPWYYEGISQFILEFVCEYCMHAWKLKRLQRSESYYLDCCAHKIALSLALLVLRVRCPLLLWFPQLFKSRVDKWLPLFSCVTGLGKRCLIKTWVFCTETLTLKIIWMQHVSVEELKVVSGSSS